MSRLSTGSRASELGRLSSSEKPLSSSGSADVSYELLESLEDTGKAIWISCKKDVWSLGEIISSTPTHVKVLRGNREETLAIEETSVHDPSHDLNINDISNLNNLSEAPLLHLLRRRFVDNSIYTYCGHVLISVNPYKTIPNLYGNYDDFDASSGDSGSKDDAANGGRSSILDSGSADLSAVPSASSNFSPTPHVYSIAQTSFSQLSTTQRDQSVIISGESGAGKTEASKHVMRYLIEKSAEANAASGTKLGDEIQGRLMESNIILESFGNAKTLRNDNSSRFGKYIKLKYGAGSRIVGAATQTFLLEKSRLVSVEAGERNYHAFYQILAEGSLSDQRREELGLSEGAAGFNMTSMSECTTVSEVDDCEEFKTTMEALSTLGIGDGEEIVAFCAAMLHLGNVTATKNEADEERPLDVGFGKVDIAFVGGLLGVDPNLLKQVTNTRIQTSGRGSTTTIPLNEAQTVANVKALIKRGYGNLFKWLVARINSSHGETVASTNFLGILDIFGFEIMETNSFEQLCINFANECLQKQFNENVFVLEKERYVNEGLDPSMIVFRDNQSVIDCISKKSGSLFIKLEEHGMMNRKPDNKALLRSYYAIESESFSKPRFGEESFVVKHFAGDVEYSIENFIEKNNDSLNQQLLDLMKGSSVGFVQTVFTLEDEEDRGRSDSGAASGAGAGARSRAGTTMTKMAATRTVSSIFRRQLDNLMATLTATDPSYIKCIKPNGVKMPGGFSNGMVVEQLRYSGVLEVVRIRRQGYPVRMPFRDFFSEFEILLYGRGFVSAETCSEEEARVACVEIGKVFLDVSEKEDLYQVGKTKVFLRDGVLEELHFEVKEFYAQRASAIQRIVRGKQDQDRWNKKKLAVKMMQGFSRMSAQQRQYKIKQEKLAKMQRAMRAKQARKKAAEERKRILLEREQRRCATAIQCRVRARQASEKVKNIVKTNNAAILMQKSVRGMKERDQFQKQKNANIRIQNATRARHARKKLDQLRTAKKESDASTKIASAFRSAKSQANLKRSRNAAIQLQCMARLLKARKVFFSEQTKERLRVEAERRRAAARMQAGWRGVQAKERVKKLRFERQVRVTTLVQSFTRKCRARKEFLAYKSAVVSIQNRKRVIDSKSELVRRKVARDNEKATTAQAAFRAHAQRRAFRKQKESVIKLQSKSRERAARADFDKSKRSCTVLQTRVRTWKAKREFENDRKSVALAQSLCRRNLCKRNFQNTKERAIHLQRLVKRFVRNIQLQAAVLKIHQAAKRGKLNIVIELLEADRTLRFVRNRYDSYKTLLHSAATSNSVELVALLCNDENDVFQLDKGGDTPFHTAAKCAAFAAMKFFADTALNAIKEDVSDGGEGIKMIGGGGDARTSLNSKFADTPIIKEGTLKKRKEWRGWDKRWAKLHTDRIAYFKRKDDDFPQKEVFLKDAMIKKSETEKYAFEIHSPHLLDKKNKEGRIYFAAESEIELQEWYTALRESEGRSMNFRERRTSPRSYLSVMKRMKLSQMRNERGESAVHMVVRSEGGKDRGSSSGGDSSSSSSSSSRRPSVTNRQSQVLMIEIALWLAENGCDLDYQNSDGLTALHIAVREGKISMATALVRKGASMDIQDASGKTPMDLLSSQRDIERVCMIGNVGMSEKKALLGVPKKLPNCSYLSLMVEKIALSGAGDLECPYVSISLVNSSGDKIEETQDISRFVYKNETCLWWSSTYHIQTPLENLGAEGNLLLLELKDERTKGKKVVTKTICWTFLPLNDSNINTKAHTIECYEAPVKTKIDEESSFVTAKCGGFFSFDSYLSQADDSS